MVAGDDSARDALFDHVYGELRKLASSHLARAGGDLTLQPTALVHEAYLKLIEIEDPSFQGRRQFYALASRVMRTLLVDRARARNAQKRGGGANTIAIDSQAPAPDRSDDMVDLLDLALALDELARVDEELGQVAELRYLGGLAVQDIADTMNASMRTTERRLKVANAWLRDRLDGG